MTNITSTNIKITETEKSKINDLDFSSLTFGQNFTDHMFVCDYINGTQVHQKLSLICSICNLTLHLVFFIMVKPVFEIMKAYKDDADKIWLFRPEDNFNRINKSSERLAMPSFPKAYFLQDLKRF